MLSLLAVSLIAKRKRLLVQTCRQPHVSVCLSVCQSVNRSVRKVYCSKTADWIWMPFGVVSGVGRGMGVLDGGGDRQREGEVLGINAIHPSVTNGDFAA